MNNQPNKKIIQPDQLLDLVKQLKAKGKRVVSLNGSFDLLHAGHLYMIEEAKKQGDILILALNSDDSIKRYKSPLRPIISLNDRMQMIAALEKVDYVTFFDEIDPREVLKKIEPDVHVNGLEYGQDCIEAQTVKELGGTLYLVPRIEGLSTSSIIKKIKSLCD
ncbi:MAG: D-glycero-beta-D-manno-heptose 1-phosphate adenylyltransferase [Chlamydiae bacterium]|jgi:rfaE bifunctional protein nucleotidyltransferase chain/domain|nr:D-glycero-beta-D-manno-heptose 1-phosphate adenylyltransferase [Chlamydiota bacterium]